MKHRQVPLTLINYACETSLKEMRLLAGATLHEASKRAGISYSQLWKAEAGYARLVVEQEKILTEFYRARIEHRRKRVDQALGRKA